MVRSASTASRPSRRGTRLPLPKPSGLLDQRVQAVGPEHFGIVSVDCAKQRSRWMLRDFYGRVLLVRHRRDLVRKTAAVQCQIREHLQATLPGLPALFEDDKFWTSSVAMPLARRMASPEAIRKLGPADRQRSLQRTSRLVEIQESRSPSATRACGEAVHTSGVCHAGGRQKVRNCFSPVVDERRVEVWPECRILEVRIHSWKRAVHGESRSSFLCCPECSLACLGHDL